MYPTYFEVSENGKIFVKRDSERLIATECPFPIADEFVSDNFIRYLYDSSYMYLDLFCYFPHLGGACWNTDGLARLFNNPFTPHQAALELIYSARKIVECYIRERCRVVTYELGGECGITKFYIHHLLESGECRISLLENGKDEDFPISVLNGSISKDLFKNMFKNKYDSMLYSTYLLEVPGKGLFWNLSAIRQDFKTSPITEDGISMAFYHLWTVIEKIKEHIVIREEISDKDDSDLETLSDLY